MNNELNEPAEEGGEPLLNDSNVALEQTSTAVQPPESSAAEESSMTTTAPDLLMPAAASPSVGEAGADGVAPEPEPMLVPPAEEPEEKVESNELPAPVLWADDGDDETSTEKLFEVEPISERDEEITRDEAEIYWRAVLTGNPETVPLNVRDRAGAEDAGLTPEQQEYVLCSAINRSWLADHSSHSRRELLVNWGKYRAELAAELGVADDEKEVFVALSARESEAPRRDMARKVYEHAYFAALHGEQKYEVRQFCRRMSREERDIAEVIGINAYREGQIIRERCLPYARNLADGFEAFYAVESDFFSLPDVLSSSPGLLRAIDDFNTLSEEDRSTTVYLAARLHREKRMADGDSPQDEGLFSRGVRAVRRGAANLGFGVFQAVNHTGVAMLDNLGELVGGEIGGELRQGSSVWDRRMQTFNEIRHLAQQENAPVLRPNAGRAEMFFLEGAQAVPAAVLSCCGGAGFGTLALSGMGESVAEARRRAPEGDQKLQLAAGVIAGAVQGAIYMALNRLGGRMFEQTMNNFMKARGSGMVNYTLAGLKSAAAMSVDGVKLMLANKAAAAADFGVHELAARASGTASNIDWMLFGNNIIDIECNLREAGAILPFLLIGAGRLALRHFRSPDEVLGSGRRLLEWKVPEKVVNRLLSERDIDLKNEMLREAVCESELWNDSNHRYSMDIMRAMQLLHIDRYLPFRDMEKVRDFLNLSGDFAATESAKPAQPVTERTSAALMLRSNWEQQAGLDGSRPIDIAEMRSQGSGRSGVLNGRGYYRNAYMFTYENMAEDLSFLHRNGMNIPQAEPIRRAVLTTYADELQKCSYRMLLQLYPQDVMTLDNGTSLPQLKEQAEATRQRYLNLVGHTIMELAEGKPRNTIYDEFAAGCGAILAEYRESPGSPGWLRSTPDYLVDNIAAECRNYDNVKMDGLPDMRTFYRLLHRSRVCAAVLADFLPMSDIFQDYMIAGRSPAQAYEAFLSQALGYRSASTPAQPPEQRSELRSDFERKSARNLALYTVMSGHKIEYSPPGEDGTRYCRMMRPDGHYTPWFEKPQQLANSIAGHNVVLFAPIGSRADRFIASDFHNPDAPLTLPTAGELEYSPFDRMCSNAVAELAQAWMSDVTHIQPGMRRNTHKKLNVSLLYNSVDKPVVEYMPGTSNTENADLSQDYNIDQYAMLTPSGLAYSRFIVYWARQLNSGMISADQAGDFLLGKQLISHEQMQKILKLGVPRPRPKNMPLNQDPVGDVRGMNMQMAEQMGRFTLLYFLARMPELNLPWSVKTWYNSLAFCPEIPKVESPLTGRGAAPFPPGWKSVNALMWYNSQTGVRLRELAPQIEYYRNNYCGEMGDSLVEKLLPAAIDADPIMQAEQAWGHYLNGDSVFEVTGAEHWNLLCHPLTTWQRMSDAQRAGYEPVLRDLCRVYPLPTEESYTDVAEAAIRNLDSVLRERSNLHNMSYLRASSGQLHTLELQDNRTFYDNGAETPGWQLEPQPTPRVDYKIEPDEGEILLPRDSRAEHALRTLDLLRSCVYDVPYQAPDESIIWQGKRYGGEFEYPAGLRKWTVKEPLLGLRDLLGNSLPGLKEAETSDVVTIAGVPVPLLSRSELECSPLRGITLYTSPKYASQHHYRLMPGWVNAPAEYLRRPYVVGVRSGFHIGTEGPDADRIPASAHVPLPEFSRQVSRLPYCTEGELMRLRRRIAARNLEQVFTLAERGPVYTGTVQEPDETLTELLMRLYEDTGFSSRLEKVDVRELDVGSLLALRVGAELLSCVGAPDNFTFSDTQAAYARLQKTGKMLRDDPERMKLLIEGLLPGVAAPEKKVPVLPVPTPETTLKPVSKHKLKQKSQPKPQPKPEPIPEQPAEPEVDLIEEIKIPPFETVEQIMNRIFGNG